MSFTRTRYEANNGDIHPIRIASSTAAAAGSPPTGSVSNDIQALVVKSSRRAGLRARGVVLYREVGTAPNTFNRFRFLPALTEARWNALSPESEVQIGGTTWTVLRRVAEDVN